MENIHKRRIIAITICLITLIVSIVLLLTQNLAYAFKNTKEVNNIIELEECNDGDMIRLKFSYAYGTNYWYEENGVQVARFLDIEVNGKALIALVDKEVADRVLENEDKEMYIEGIWQNFQNEDMLHAYEGIKQNYLEDFSGEMSEEEILNLFTTKQLLSYGVQKPSLIYIAVLILVAIASTVCLIKHSFCKYASDE